MESPSKGVIQYGSARATLWEWDLLILDDSSKEMIVNITTSPP